MWDSHSGPTGTWEVRSPPGTYAGPAELQTARQRARARGGDFYVAMKPSDSVGPAHRIISSETTIAWRATFEPVRRDLPRAYPWLHFDTFDLLPDDKRVVSRMVAQDQRDGVLTELIPEEFPRKLVIGSANFGLVLGSRMGAAVSMDAMHSHALSARVARGQAAPVLGAGALTIVFPSAASLSWDEIDEARRTPGMQSLRARLREIEAIAWEAADTGLPFDAAVIAAYTDALHREIDALKPSFRGAVGAVVLGAGVSIVTGPLPLAIGVVAGAIEVVSGAAIARHRQDHSWMAAADRLRKATRKRPLPR